DSAGVWNPAGSGQRLRNRAIHLHPVLTAPGALPTGLRKRESAMKKAILGVSAYYHDSAAAILVDGQIAAAAQEERFTRKKHDSSFPIHACRYVLQEAGIEYRELAAVAFYDKPFLKF